MLAQSLFAPVVSAAPLAGDASAPPADDGDFGRLINKATREAQSDAPLEGPPLKPTAKVSTDGIGPQVLPGVETAPPKTVHVGPPRPEVLPGEQPSVPDVEVLPTEDLLKPPAKPEVTDAPRREVLPGEVALDPAPRPEVLPGEIAPPPPRPEVLPAKSSFSDAQSTAATDPAPPPVPSSQGREPTSNSAAGEHGTGSVSSQEASAAETPSAAAKPESAPAQAQTAAPQAGAPRAPAAPAPALEALRAEPAPQPANSEAPAPAIEPGSAAPADSPIFALSRVAHETLAGLTAQVVKRLEGKYTRFEMALTPEDLGRVDVRLEMGEDGSLTARLAFDSPAAAAEMRAQADQLRRQLEQAGFQLAHDALDFSHGDGAASQRRDTFERRQNRAFAEARDLAARAEAGPLLNLSLSLGTTRDRVDVKV